MKVLISGGGTGGHIFPALSIANAVKRRHPDAQILFVGAENRMEMQRVPEAGYEIIGLPVAGFDRKRLWRNFGVLIKLWKSMSQAKSIVKNFKPDIAIGVGGYASGPTLKAAQKAGVPTLLQEQNSYPGVTNKLLAAGSQAICVAYQGLEKYFPKEKIMLTGNPVRADLTKCMLTPQDAKRRLGFNQSKPLTLVVGGSLGARTINQSIAANISQLAKSTQLLWQTGKNEAQKWADAAQSIEGVKATTFISDMALAYCAADLVVSRAGAGTISELEILGKATVLVPSPNVAEDHQRKNAQALADNGAAVMVLDADAPEQLAPTIIKLISEPQQRQALSSNIVKMALRDADEAIADKIDQIVRQNSKL